MPNPVPLATKEEEERRAWVTAHHEVVRLVKDCFGDRFSNNEIFDRLKISRRTGYRALGNDERIGKAAGRKPKIPDPTIREMIEYIEAGGCRDVGNVWKHLASKFAPDCNPKTVQDSIKKSGFKNYNDQVKLGPLLSQVDLDDSPAPLDDDSADIGDLTQQAPANHLPDYSPAVQQPQSGQHDPHHTSAPSSSQQHQNQQHPYHPASSQHGVIDSIFASQGPHDVLRQCIETMNEAFIRNCLHDIVSRNTDAAYTAMSMFCPWVITGGGMHAPIATPTVTQLFSNTLTSAAQSGFQAGLGDLSGGVDGNDVAALAALSKQKRMATCRRCGEIFDRADNTMSNRGCSYHKGSPQKISPGTEGKIDQSPEAYIWSCCGGNGSVRGCTRAMHTTKKKRNYKKRDECGVELDDDAASDDGETASDAKRARIVESDVDQVEVQGSSATSRLSPLENDPILQQSSMTGSASSSKTPEHQEQDPPSSAAPFRQVSVEEQTASVRSSPSLSSSTRESSMRQSFQDPALAEELSNESKHD